MDLRKIEFLKKKLNFLRLGCAALSAFILFNSSSALSSQEKNKEEDNIELEFSYECDEVKTPLEEYIAYEGKPEIKVKSEEDIIKEEILQNLETSNDNIVLKTLEEDYNIEREPTIEEKKEWIAENYNITLDQLEVVIGGMICESIGGGYDETYRVTSVLYNRTKSKSCVRCYGPTIYDEYTGKNQFSTYSSGNYKLFMGRTDLAEYAGAVDMLYTMKPAHNYISFRASWVKVKKDYEQYMDRGNKFFNELTEEDRIEEDLTLSRSLA